MVFKVTIWEWKTYIGVDKEIPLSCDKMIYAPPLNFLSWNDALFNFLSWNDKENPLFVKGNASSTKKYHLQLANNVDVLMITCPITHFLQQQQYCAQERRLVIFLPISSIVLVTCPSKILDFGWLTSNCYHYNVF